MDRLSAAIALRGRIRAVTRDVATGAIVADTGWLPNATTVGAAGAVAAWLGGANTTGYQPTEPPTAMELGTGTTAATTADTALDAPLADTFVGVSQRSADAAAGTTSWVAVWGPQFGGVTATEVGLFAADGTLFAHRTGLTLSLSTTTSTSVEWTLTVTPG